jgi:hypothetical protein
MRSRDGLFVAKAMRTSAARSSSARRCDCDGASLKRPTRVQGLRAKEIGRIDQPIAELFQWTAEQQAGAWQCQLYMHAFLRAVCLADDILPARARVEPAPAKKPRAVAGSILDPQLATEIEEQDRSTRWQLASPNKIGVAFGIGQRRFPPIS